MRIKNPHTEEAPMSPTILTLILHGHFPHLHNCFLFSVAMGLNFVVNDWGIRSIHRAYYDRYGRSLLGAAVLAGWPSA